VELFIELGLYAYIMYIVCDLRRSFNAIKKSTRQVADFSKEGKSNIAKNISKIKVFFVVIFFTMIVGSCVQSLQPWLYLGGYESIALRRTYNIAQKIFYISSLVFSISLLYFFYLTGEMLQETHEETDKKEDPNNTNTTIHNLEEWVEEDSINSD
jgi:hypothetical protein